MSIPTKGEEFAKLIEYLRKAQECCAMIAHLHAEADQVDRLLAKGWLGVEEMLKMIVHHITKLATRKLQ